MYLVKLGSFTVVARSPREAVKLRARLMDQAEDDDMIVCDMDGFPVDLEEVIQQSEMD